MLNLETKLLKDSLVENSELEQPDRLKPTLKFFREEKEKKKERL